MSYIRKKYTKVPRNFTLKNGTQISLKFHPADQIESMWKATIHLPQNPRHTDENPGLRRRVMVRPELHVLLGAMRLRIATYLNPELEKVHHRLRYGEIVGTMTGRSTFNFNPAVQTVSRILRNGKKIGEP